MGIRVMFFHGSADGMASHFLSAPLHEFRAWYQEMMEEFPEEVNPACVFLLEEVIYNGRPSLKRASEESPKTVDLLLADYYGLFADFRDKLYEASGTCINIRKYQSIGTQLKRDGMEEAAVLVDYIFSGRPVLRDAAEFPFFSEDDVFRLAYWTAEEVVRFRAALDPLGEAEQRQLDPEWGALPAIQESLANAHARKSGLIITVA